MSPRLTLRELGPADEAAFRAALESWAGESRHWITFDWRDGMEFADHLERLAKNARGEDLPAAFVPSTMLYAFVDGVIVGRVNVRHRLNEMLRRRGGHLGYSVAPAFRRRGYAAEMFRQSLPFCRTLGIQRLMITCDDSNEPSWRLLDRAGAVLEEKFFDDADGSTARRYRFDL